MLGLLDGSFYPESDDLQQLVLSPILFLLGFKLIAADELLSRREWPAALTKPRILHSDYPKIKQKMRKKSKKKKF